MPLSAAEVRIARFAFRIKSRARLAAPRVRHLFAAGRQCPSPSEKHMLFRLLLNVKKSAGIHGGPTQIIAIRRQWWGGLVGRLWREDNCISSPLAKRRRPRSRDGTATGAGSISRSKREIT